MRSTTHSSVWTRVILAAVVAIVTCLPTANANIVGSDFQSFNPTSDGLDFVTVQSVRTLAPGVLGVGGFLDGAFNTLPAAYDVNGKRFFAQDQILSSDLHAALGLAPGWEIGINLESAIAESLNSDQLSSYFVRSGVTDVRLNTKYRLSGDHSEGWAVNLIADIPQIQNDPFYGGGTAFAYTGELIYQMRIGRWLWGTNAGADFRNPGPPMNAAPYQPVGSEWLASTALDFRPEHSNWGMIGELFGAMPFSGTRYNTIADLTALEALAGVKFFGYKNLTIHMGATAAVLRGTSSPDFRAYAGFNWYPARLWGSQDQAKRPTEKPPEEPKLVADADTLAALAEPTPQPAPSPTPVPEVVASSSAEDVAVFDKEPTAPVERFLVRDVNFETASAAVPNSFMPYLKKLADYTRKGRSLKKLQISGHTDSVGRATYNQDLSQRRAESVKRVLIERFGLDSDKIEAIGMGSTAPVATNETAAGRSLNRRVEFRIERAD